MIDLKRNNTITNPSYIIWFKFWLLLINLYISINLNRHKLIKWLTNYPFDLLRNVAHAKNVRLAQNNCKIKIGSERDNVCENVRKSTFEVLLCHNKSNTFFHVKLFLLRYHFILTWIIIINKQYWAGLEENHIPEVFIFAKLYFIINKK